MKLFHWCRITWGSICKGTLGSMVKTMCATAGITGNKPYACMKAMCLKKLFMSELDIWALHTYQRTSLQLRVKADFINLVSEAVAQVSVGLALPNTSASVHSAYGSCLPPTGSSEASVGPSSTGSSSFHLILTLWARTLKLNSYLPTRKLFWNHLIFTRAKPRGRWDVL